jgi:uncharacterized YigZ family protein
METANKYRTISSPAIAEFKDRGSRFLAFVFPVRTADEIKAHVKALKAEHPKAAHHCVAWRLGYDGSQYRAGDDGEPSGSAGRPMLGALDSAGLTNVLVVVVRYFGGTLLGVPGLIHAYRHVTELALSNTALVDHWIEKEVSVECDYATMGEVLYLLRKHEASIYKQDMQLFCTIQAGIPLHTLESCLQKLSEIRGVTCRQSQ